LFAALTLTLLPGVAHAQNYGYVGPENCKACHPRAYELWKNGPHAHAMQSLEGRSAKDGRCLSCHAPQAEKGIAAVTCESCHGPGQYYSPAYVMKDAELSRAVGLEDPGEKSCRSCHDASSPSLKSFDFKEKLKTIDHWTVEKKKEQSQREVQQWLEQAFVQKNASVHPIRAQAQAQAQASR
jgi:hypothetical protein